MTNETARCEGCGQQPEVHGSSWCSHCAIFLSRYTKNRIIKMRNALLEIESWSGRDPSYVNEVATEALKPVISSPEAQS